MEMIVVELLEWMADKETELDNEMRKTSPMVKSPKGMCRVGEETVKGLRTAQASEE